MRGLVVLTSALAALAAPGLAQTPPSLIAKPDWAARPTAGDIARFLPAATRQGVSGEAVIECRVTEKGRLEACTVVSETPPDRGFGKAALAMAGKFRMKPQTVDGQPTAGGTVRIPIKISAPGAPPPAPDLPATTGRFVYAGPAPDVATAGGPSTRAVFYLRLGALRDDGAFAAAEMITVFEHPLTSPAMSKSYAVSIQVFDCSRPRTWEPQVQYFDDAGQRVSWLPVGDEVPLRAALGLDQARALACGKAQPDAPILDSITAVRADAKTRFGGSN